MYKIYAENYDSQSPELIYSSAMPHAFPLIHPVLHMEWDQAPTLDFSMLPGHPFYDRLDVMATFVSFYRDDVELFWGRVLTIDRDTYGQKDVYCEGALNFLSDGEVGSCDGTESISAFLRRCVNAHNATVDERKQLEIGNIAIQESAEKQIYVKLKNYTKPKDALQDQLVSRFGGLLWIRKTETGHALDYVSSPGANNHQLVRIGRNIIDKSDHASGEPIFTVFRPTGKDDLAIAGGVIEIPEMIAKYGRIYRHEEFDDIDNATTLLAEANAFISRKGMSSGLLPATCDISFVDFHLLNPEVQVINFGDVFTNIEGYEGQTMTVAVLELDGENPANDKMTLYNDSYLNDRDYASILGASTGSSSSSGRSYSSRSSLGTALAASQEEISKETIIQNETIKLIAQRLMLAAEEIDIQSKVLFGTGEEIHFIASEGKDGVVSDIMTGAHVYARADALWSLIGKITTDDDGNIHIASGHGLVVDKEKLDEEGERYTASLGIFDEDTLTAGVLVEKINNGGAGDKINASRIQLTADFIQAIADQIDIDTPTITLTSNAVIQAINRGAEQGETQLTIDVDKLNLTGTAIANALESYNGSIGTLHVDHLIVDTQLDVGESAASYFDLYPYAGNENTGGQLSLGRAIASLSASVSGGNVVITPTLLNGTTGTSVNFNIADMQYFLDSISAAKTIDTNATIALSASDFGQTVTRSVSVTNGYDGTSTFLAFDISVPAAPEGTAATLEALYSDEDATHEIAVGATGRILYVPLKYRLSTDENASWWTSRINVDASLAYEAGQNAVSITGPVWSSTQGGLATSAQATFYTDAPTPDTENLNLYLTQSDGKVYLRSGSANGDARAAITISEETPDLYYWVNNQRYDPPTGNTVLRIPQGIDYMVGTDTGNRFWVGAESTLLYRRAVSGGVAGQWQVFAANVDGANYAGQTIQIANASDPEDISSYVGISIPAAVSQRNADSLSSVTLSALEINTSSHTVTVTYSDGTTSSVPINVNAYNVYTTGKNYIMENWGLSLGRYLNGSSSLSYTTLSNDGNDAIELNYGEYAFAAIMLEGTARKFGAIKAPDQPRHTYYDTRQMYYISERTGQYVAAGNENTVWYYETGTA